MAARFGFVIESALKAPGVVTAVLVDASGHAIEGASWTEGDLAATSRSAGEMLQWWTSVGSELGIGDVRFMLIEGPGGPVTISPAPGGMALVMVGSGSCAPGRLRHEARLATTLMAEPAAGAAAAPEPVPAPAETMSEAGRSAGRVTAGEVVLVGAHTFRLVTKLVARLLQTKGVRSSRLRAYSPASTIIDVLLEEGATLAAIGRNCLDEFLIEPTAEAHSRLVLKAGKPSVGAPTAIGTPG